VAKTRPAGITFLIGEASENDHALKASAKEYYVQTLNPKFQFLKPSSSGRPARTTTPLRQVVQCWARVPQTVNSRFLTLAITFLFGEASENDHALKASAGSMYLKTPELRKRTPDLGPVYGLKASAGEEFLVISGPVGAVLGHRSTQELP